MGFYIDKLLIESTLTAKTNLKKLRGEEEKYDIKSVFKTKLLIFLFFLKLIFALQCIQFANFLILKLYNAPYWSSF